MGDDLQRQLDEQKVQLENYENKLKNVVAAYKSLQTEKKALEVALGAVSGDRTQVESEESDGNESEVDSLKRAITTLTVEGKKKELAYQSDKKLLLSKNEKLQTMVDALQANCVKQKDVSKYNEKIRFLEQEREKLVTDHGAMLNSVQKRFAEEVGKVKKCEQTITDLYKQIHTKDQQLQANAAIVSQFEKVQDEMLRWKKQAESTPRESVLIHQLQELKIMHESELELERNKRSASKSAVSDKDDRILELETRVEGLTQQVAQAEQNCVQLEEQLRFKQHETESVNSDALSHRISRLDFIKMYEKLKSTDGFDVYEVLSLPRPHVSKGSEPKQKLCTSTESCTKCTASIKELSYFKSVVSHLQNQVKFLEESQEQTRDAHEEVTKCLRGRITELEAAQEATYSELTSATRKKVAELEQELYSQRERMAQILEEKDNEIQLVKNVLESMRRAHCRDPVDPPQPRPSSHHMDGSFDEDRPSFSNYFNDDILSGRSLSTSQLPDQQRNIYVEQEAVKMEQEIVELRNVLRLSEQKIGDLEQASLTKDMQYLQIIEALKEEVRVLEGKLDLQSTDTNMEYLRNIFVQFLNSKNSAGRKCVLRAMALVLKLTPTEMRRLESGSF